jgi:hypothetical protein
MAIEDSQKKIEELESRLSELIAQMGDQIAPFPKAGIDGFLSHFVFTIQFSQGALQDRALTIQMPSATQTVSRSDPFIYHAKKQNAAKLPLPKGCTLPNTITESDFLEKPDGYFEDGRETVWMQILNLDAQMDVPGFGHLRIILGETLKREYSDIFEPSHGVAQSLGRQGFPAKLFFNPYAIIETPFGAFRAIHGTLTYGRVTAFPPVGTPVTILKVNPLESVDAVRAELKGKASVRPRDIVVQQPAGQLLGLAHPIDAALRNTGEEAFALVERSIRAASA